MDCQQCQNKQHGDIVLEKAHHMFLCSLQMNIKKAHLMRFSTAGYVRSTQTRFIFNPAVAFRTRQDDSSLYVDAEYVMF